MDTDLMNEITSLLFDADKPTLLAIRNILVNLKVKENERNKKRRNNRKN